MKSPPRANPFCAGSLRPLKTNEAHDARTSRIPVRASFCPPCERSRWLRNACWPQFRPTNANTARAEDSRSAFELAWHIASVDVWFLDGFLKGKFEMDDDDSIPADFKDSDDVVAWYDENFLPKLDEVARLGPEFWATPMPFFGIYNFPAVLYLQFMLYHTIHHRGQLTAYLRPMGAKVPNIYGGSFDEPMEMPPNSCRLRWPASRLSKRNSPQRRRERGELQRSLLADSWNGRGAQETRSAWQRLPRTPKFEGYLLFLSFLALSAGTLRCADAGATR